MAQFVRPTSDVTNGWASGGFEDINEASPSDADFTYSIDKPASDVLEVHVGDPTTPMPDTGHVVRYRVATVDGGVLSGDGTLVTLDVSLYQGATLISGPTAATGFNNATWSPQSFTVSEAEAANITDYSDLRIRFLAAGGAGSPGDRRGAAVSWAEVELPDATSGPAVAILTNHLNLMASNS